MSEARRKTNLLLRVHPVLWGLWVFLVLFTALFGFQLVLAVPFVTLFGMLYYANSTGYEIEYIVPLEDSEITANWYGGVRRICRFGAIAGACGLCVHLAYLLTVGYGRNTAFVRVMDWLDVRFRIISEIGFGVGPGMYGELDMISDRGIGRIDGVLPQMLCVIAISALCFALGMLLLYRLGLRAVNDRVSKNEETGTLKNRLPKIIFRVAMVFYLVVGIGLMAFRFALFGRFYVAWLVGLSLMIAGMLWCIRSTLTGQNSPEYAPERTDG
ncbi:MAG: hypothetical protein J6Y20_12240 [Lachnospiraceae bacterium]|nr:hypothetical protein [Lachnospiraceae bacterium]